MWQPTKPISVTCAFIGALSIIGLPPLGGSWAKWQLLLGSIEATQWLIVGALLLSSLLNIAYLIPVAARAFYPLPAGSAPVKIEEAPLLCVVPLCITAAGSVLLFFFGDSLYQLISLIPLRAAS